MTTNIDEKWIDDTDDEQCEFWLSYDAGSDRIQLPVLPESFKVKCGSNNSSIDVLELGEVTTIQAIPARQFSWSSFFPAYSFPGIQVQDIIPPSQLVQQILEWKGSNKPVRFTITNCDINIYCTIERFDFTEKGGDVGSIYYDITLKEFNEPEVRTIKLKKKSSSTSKKKTKASTKKKAKTSKKKKKKRTSNKKTKKTYKIKSGDTLWGIAKKVYGSGSKWKKIYNANKKKIGGNPNKISIGVVLTIPK